MFVTLFSVVFGGCDSGVDMEDLAISDSGAIKAAQQFYEDFHERNTQSPGDSIRGFVLAEMIRQYSADWAQAVAWPDGRGGMYQP